MFPKLSSVDLNNEHDYNYLEAFATNHDLETDDQDLLHAKCHCMSLNIEKTNFVIFPSSQKRIGFSPNLYLNQMAIKEESSIRYLGIYIDCNLSWKIQIQNVSKKNLREI